LCIRQGFDFLNGLPGGRDALVGDLGLLRHRRQGGEAR
jgi:hypothetical protein